MRFVPFLLLAIASTAFSQTNTEVYLFDISPNGDSYTIDNQRNISNNEGYDSQPSFLGKDAVLYAGTRDGQTEIIQYGRGNQKVFNATTSGGEYSPQAMPGGRGISAVRLDTDGLQRIYSYAPRKGVSKKLIKDAVVAYYTWADASTIVAADIVEQDLHLVIHNIQTGANEDLGINVGRSFHKIPDTDLVSFVDKSTNDWIIKSIHPKTKKIETIIAAIPNTEDLCWLPDGSLLAAKENTLFIYRKGSKGWDVLHSFSDDNLKNLSRVAASPDGSQIAVVSAVSPAAAVQKHVDAYNSGDLDAFVNSFSENVVVRTFDGDTMYVGREKMRSRYANGFKNNTSFSVKVVTRIVHNNVVIDEEIGTTNGIVDRKASIYEVKNGKIASMSFIFDTPTKENPVKTLDKQIDAYNNGNVKKFMSWFSEDIALYNYPDTPSMTSTKEIEKTFGNMFKQLPDLHVNINKRIVVGTIIIDHEELNAKGNTWYGVAINEIKNGKIHKMTFVQ